MALATSLPSSPAYTTDLQRRRVGWSAFLGTTIEYYDFTLYGLMGPIVFGKLFFPQSDPNTALIAVLAIYAVGFFGRPVGGFVFSHYGDRLGRKPMMIISMTVMGLASTAMGLLPSYASIGVWAPVLLLALRIVQGFARVPFIELMRTNWKPWVIVLLAAMAESASGFFFLVFGFSYAVAQLKIPPTTLLQSLLIGNTIGLILAPMFGALSDCIGRRTTLSAAYIIAAIYTATAFFPMLESGDTMLIYLAMILPVAIVSPLSIGVIGSFYSEQFSDARLRYSGVGVGRGLGTTLGGGLMPVIATGLMAMTGGSRIGPIVWFGIVCIAGATAILTARETKDDILS